MQICPMCGTSFGHATGVAEVVHFCPACGTSLAENWTGIDDLALRAVRRYVRPPAAGLVVGGTLMVLVGLTIPLLTFVSLAFGGFRIHIEEERLDILLRFGPIAAFGLFSFVAGCWVIFGGYRMYHLRSWRSAVWASVLAIGSVFGCCALGRFGIFELPAVPAGMWALVVLNNEHVRPAFR